MLVCIRICILVQFDFDSGNGIPGDWPEGAAGGPINWGRCGLCPA